MQKTADDMRISDWSSDVCSSDLIEGREHRLLVEFRALPEFEVEMARKGQIFKIILFLARSRERRRQPARGRSLAGGSSRLEQERVGALAETEDEEHLARLSARGSPPYHQQTNTHKDTWWENVG